MSLFGIFIIALIMAFAFSPYKRNNPVGPLLVLFFILLLAGFAAHYWIIPFGPRVWGVSWFPVLVMMFAFGLLFSSSPSVRRRRRTAAENEAQEQEEASVAIGLFIWVVLFLLLAAVLIGMYHSSSTLIV